MSATTSKERTDLHELLILASPGDKKGVGTIRRTLAPALGVSYQYVFRWVQEKRIPPKYARKIVELSDGRVTLDDILPYALP